MLSLEYTTKFKRDYKLAKKQGKPIDLPQKLLVKAP